MFIIDWCHYKRGQRSEHRSSEFFNGHPRFFFVSHLPKLFSEFTTHFPQEVKRVDPANRLPCPIQQALASLSKTVD